MVPLQPVERGEKSPSIVYTWVSSLWVIRQKWMATVLQPHLAVLWKIAKRGNNPTGVAGSNTTGPSLRMSQRNNTHRFLGSSQCVARWSEDWKIRRYGVKACGWSYGSGHKMWSCLYYMLMPTRKHQPQKSQWIPKQIKPLLVNISQLP